ncbi:hypothetical protein BVC80_8821g7 [Macleaya cordata]|uniref:Uncharacterized protein n=1 Tax=Macleaya cordata TaxID=56857 RepID=A0A200PSE4_MACCD|nr:hypothetical protein BVC80_8821g7 [Macleaya cordata]
MKKLYKKGKVHPSPPLISDHLAFLPATILTLTAALSPEDREVLAYLISCSGTPGSFSGGRKNTQNQKSTGGGGVGGGGGGAEHPPLFHCDCFRCYTSYWVRWDGSPNRQLIHEIIDAFEDELLTQKKKMKNKKDRKKKGSSDEVKKKRFEEISSKEEICESESVEIDCGGSDNEIIGGVGEGELDLERGSMRKFISFVGERIWGVLGQ